MVHKLSEGETLGAMCPKQITDARRPMGPPPAPKALVKLPARIRAADSLNTINDVITDKLKKWDCFDLDVEKSMLSAVKRVAKARDLEWRDPEFEVDNVITIVVGHKGADFEDHERRR
jgi:hypothetical protein